MAGASLLPGHHEEFRTREYWDRFFRERNEEAFEWYGSFEDVRAKIVEETRLKRGEATLVIGCGNSDFSAQLYDQGFHAIRNLDFSEQVIAEMRAKNQVSRPEMSWDLGDMTDMKELYADGQFDVVFDKGALDALMSVESEQVLRQAAAMFCEIDRVLSAKGRYLCITLAEPYILQNLLSGFTTDASIPWSIGIESLNISKPSPFKPLLITVQRSTVSGSGSIVSLFVDQMGRSLVTPELVPISSIIQKVSALQGMSQKIYDLRDIRRGRFDNFDIFSPDHGEIPRFTIMIIDSEERSTLSCAVFFIPAGRESEYQFSTQAGLQGIALQANCKRLLAVRCNRPHSFPPSPIKLQDELDLVVLALKPTCCSIEEKIPYMAVEADTSWETIAAGSSELSGQYIVEESDVEEGTKAPAKSVLRRLIFLQNQNFVQTEMRLVERRAPAAGGGGKGGGGGKKSTGGKDSKAKKGAVVGDGREFDHTYMDAHHCSVLAGMTLSPRIVKGGMRGAAIPTNPKQKQQQQQDEVQGLVVGLGGGAMAMCLQRYLPEMRLFVCDIDGEMEKVARSHFGFRCVDKCHVAIAEGMELLARIRDRIAGNVSAEAEPASPLDFLFIDVDSKDPSLGMSAPPRSFATKEALELMHAILRPGGLLAVNVAARSQSMFQEFIAGLRAVFTAEALQTSSSGRVFTVRGSEDLVNVTVLALKADEDLSVSLSSPPADVKQTAKQTSTKGTLPDPDARERRARESLLYDWLQAAGLQADPLELADLVAKLS
jgi:ubiquinone/menaquinone biosynthesis C-methylase UbiE